MYVNHNQMATNVANTLTDHYGNLQTSTRRLSSGLRINSAADDAAGLAIRELMRSDIAALQQGARNANDAISLIQTADGALGVIDEKLVRMKELAEQASTGTYDATQRKMIDDEYQAMAAEITRIANATDFNGIHLLDGSLEGQHDGETATPTGALKVHFGTANDAAEDYYFLNINDCTAEALGLGKGATLDNMLDRLSVKFKNSLSAQIDAAEGDPFTAAAKGALQKLVDTYADDFKSVLSVLAKGGEDNIDDVMEIWNAEENTAGSFLSGGKETGYNLEFFVDKNEFATLSDRDKEKWQFAWAKAALYNYGHPKEFTEAEQQESYGFNNGEIGALMAYTDDDVAGVNLGDFEKLRSAALAEVYEASKTFSAGGRSIATQEEAQMSLVAVNNAIVAKDNVRASLGATQNRLENTVTNLTIQAENLQAAESRISDVDVATEMTQFVRNQILSRRWPCSLSADNVTNPRGEGNDRHGARPFKPPRRRKAASDMSPSSPIRTPYAHIKSPRGRKHLCGPRYTLYRPQDAGQAGKNRPGGSRRRHRVPGGSLSARYRAESGRAANPQ